MARVDTQRPGQLRHRVTLQRKQTTSDGVGGQDVVWTDLAEIWAAVRPLSGRDRLQAEQVQSTVTFRVTIRWRAAPDNAQMPFVFAGDRLVYKGVPYNVRAVVDLEERRRFLELDVESGVAA